MKFNVIFTTPTWDLSGVNTFTANLIKELNNSGIPATLLITDPPRQKGDYTMPLPSHIPVEKLPVKEGDNWKTRWQTIIDYLEQKAPCIYVPNYDWGHSSVSPVLSNNVGIVGIIHSDDPIHYDHVSRLGEYWNRVVCVSKAIEQKTSEICPSVKDKTLVIPYGVLVADSNRQRSQNPSTPLKLVYAGRLAQYQKRVFDLPEIVSALLEMKIPVKLTIVGDGSEGQKLRSICEPLKQKGAVEFLGTVPNEKVLEIYEQNDIFLLTSEFEGLPVSALEAMGRGCIPVVSDITSGIPELVENGVNGFRVPIGETRQFAQNIATLYQDSNLRREMSSNAYRTIKEGGYTTEDMVKKYREVFENIMQEALSGAYQRPPGEIVTSQYQPLTTQELKLPPFIFYPLRAVYLKLSGGGLENPSPNFLAKFLNFIMMKIARNARKV